MKYGGKASSTSDSLLLTAVVNPDLVLRDLVKIFHPELVEEDFVYYKQLK